MRFLPVACCAVLISGCATFGSIEGNIESRYVGKPVGAAIDGLGYPAAERVVAGRKLYTWDTDSQLPNLGPMPNGTLGIRGYTQLHCRLDLEVDGAEVVRKYSLSGQLGACENFGR
jgi:hypothetical protein